MAPRNLYQIINKVIIGALLASMLAPLANQSVFAKGESSKTSAPKSEQCQKTSTFSPIELTQTPAAQAGIQWKLTAELPVEANGAAVDALPILKAGKINATFADNKLTLGKKNTSLDQMRTALFDTAPEWMNFLGEPIDLIISMHSDGNPITLHMEARTSTGYVWEVLPDENSLYAITATTEEDAEVVTRHEGYGATAIQNIHLAAKGEGDTTVHLVYRRPFEADTNIRTQLSVSLPIASDMEISDPTPEIPANSAETSANADQMPSALDELLPKDLPTSWDWRSQGIVSPVRNQGGCGSCWAFATTGVMESAVAKSGGGLNDLSEQYLVSCNTEGWSCKGGWDSHEYNYNVAGKNQTQAGAVLESAMPYSATNGSCNSAVDHPYKLDGWGFVGGLTAQNYWNTVPTYEQLKNAIYTYGPIAAGVCVGKTFGYYTNGVFQTDEKSSCSYGSFYSPNHLIVLVGWNDADQSLILRNSWGPWWGESGYMRIKYGTSLIGIAPTWVTRTDSTPMPTQYQPSGTIYTNKPTYTWTSTNASSYKLEVYDATNSSFKVNTVVSGSRCKNNTCTFTPSVKLANNKNYKWRVASGNGSFSEFKTFTVKPSINFNTHFKSDTSGWSTVYGGWSLGSSYYQTSGKQGYFSSVKHANNYADVTYEVMMKRAGCSSCSNGIFIRGNATKTTKEKGWISSYQFFYSNNGYFSAWKANTDGTFSALSNQWVKTSAIKENDWNNLKVVASGSSLKFYINNKLVWSGQDTEFTTGRLGIGMYRDNNSSDNSLAVDWTKATLITNAAASSSSEEITSSATVSESDPRQSP